MKRMVVCRVMLPNIVQQGHQSGYRNRDFNIWRYNPQQGHQSGYRNRDFNIWRYNPHMMGNKVISLGTAIEITVIEV